MAYLRGGLDGERVSDREPRQEVEGQVIGADKDLATETWPKRRRRRRMDNRDIVIELVPGPNPYFWIGERGSGEYLTSIDADALAEWVDALRGVS